MQFKRVAIDTSKHVFTLHAVDEAERQGPTGPRQRPLHLNPTAAGQTRPRRT